MNSLPVRTWNMRRRAASCLAVLAIAALAGCGKKHAPPPPPPPPAAETGAAPTATITATPDNISPGDKVILSWKTTDATDVSIDGIGAVPSSGRRPSRLRRPRTITWSRAASAAPPMRQRT